MPDLRNGALNGLLTGLPAGTYTIGLAGLSPDGAWINNDIGTTTVRVLRAESSVVVCARGENAVGADNAAGGGPSRTVVCLVEAPGTRP